MKAYELLMLIATILTAVGGVGFVVVMVQTYKGQMNAQVFTELNQRYDKILQAFPENAWDARFHLDTGMPPPSLQLTLCALRYLNLSSEEFYLYRSKYIRKKVWKMWQGELNRTLKSPLFRREWKLLRHEFISYPEFIAFVDDAQRTT